MGVLRILWRDAFTATQDGAWTICPLFEDTVITVEDGPGSGAIRSLRENALSIGIGSILARRHGL